MNDSTPLKVHCSGLAASPMDGHTNWMPAFAQVHRSWSAELQLSDEEPFNGICSVAFSPDGRRIVSGCCSDTIKFWDAQTGSLLRTLEGHSYLVSSVAFSPDGQRIVSGSEDRTINLWDA
ncbi:WD40-repeat-containing domain protein [Aspergillus floccosus]